MKGKTCCVTGHRTIPESELERVREELEREIRIAVAEGYTHFISGFAEGADLLFADIVLRKTGIPLSHAGGRAAVCPARAHERS